jgi:hypothetical protein
VTIGIYSTLRFLVPLTNETHLCHSCLFMDKRPESGIHGSLIYCQKKRLVVSPKLECTLYVRATAQNQSDLKASIYGRIEAEEME